MSRALRAVAHLRAVPGATAGRAGAGRVAAAIARAGARVGGARVGGAAVARGGLGHVGGAGGAQGVARHRRHVGVVRVAVAHGQGVLALALQWVVRQRSGSSKARTRTL